MTSPHTSRLKGPLFTALSIFLTIVALLSLVWMRAEAATSETIVVDSVSQTGSSTAALDVVPGVTYSITVSGTYQYHSSPSFLADAECAFASPLWQRELYPNNNLDLMVAGRPVEWIPTAGAPGAGCSEKIQAGQTGHPGHVYGTFYTPEDPGPINFRILDDVYWDNSGSLTVTITRALDGKGIHPYTYIETLAVDSDDPNGTSARNGVSAGKQYMLVATGSYFYAINAPFQVYYRADAECMTYGSLMNWAPHRFGDANNDPNDLYVNGANVEWQPAVPRSDGLQCSDDNSNTYNLNFTPSVSGNLSLKVNEAPGGHNDNLGVLLVQVWRVNVVVNPTTPPTPNPTVPPVPTVPPSPTVPPTPTIPPSPPVPPSPTVPPTLPPTPTVSPPTVPPIPTPPPVEVLTFWEQLTVNTSNPGGANTTRNLRNDRLYKIFVTGTWNYDTRFGNNLADAECRKAQRGPAFANEPLWDRAGDLYDLLADGSKRDWVPSFPSAYLCDEMSHSYSVYWRQYGNRPVNFKVNDVEFSDNTGTLSVEIYEVGR